MTGREVEDSGQLAAAGKADVLGFPAPAPPDQKVKRNRFSYALAMLASLNSILLGYDGGVMSGAIIFIKDDLHINDVQVEILVGTLHIYALFGAAVAGRTSDWLGRRCTIVLTSIIFFAGALLMGFATNYAFLMFGRFVAGIGVGYALMIAPVYTAEISQASARGGLTSLTEVFINVGVLLGYVSNYAFSKFRKDLAWRLMLGIGAIPSIFLGLSVLIMPESPRWLVMKGRLGDARRSLEKVCDSKEEANMRLEEIKVAAGIPADSTGETVQVPKNNKEEGKGLWRELILKPTPPVRHVLIAALGLHFFEMATGIDAAVLYSPRIFEKAGITSNNDKLLATVALGFVKASFILIATFLLDRVGRRRLLLCSVGGMILALTTLGTALTVVNRSEEKLMWAVALCIAMVLAFVGSFSMGLGPITWVYSSEIFPLRLRAMGTALGVAVNRGTGGVVLMTFLSLSKAMTTGGVFFMFAGIAVVAWVFFYTFFPETQGKSLEDMSELFGGYFRLDYGRRKGLNSNNTRRRRNGEVGGAGDVEMSSTSPVLNNTSKFSD